MFGIDEVGDFIYDGVLLIYRYKKPYRGIAFYWNGDRISRRTWNFFPDECIVMVE